MEKRRNFPRNIESILEIMITILHFRAAKLGFEHLLPTKLFNIKNNRHLETSALKHECSQDY